MNVAVSQHSVAGSAGCVPVISQEQVVSLNVAVSQHSVAGSGSCDP
ncbi:hypothetical protein D778_01251 [Xanthomarina gelatinilytica]|uniref:Uncharacterized protein n=1 Tax=Xanthomarina gelatinilytica TaxID=1137281 RepID=M7MFV8_9FLAO|nr:hypothetical protein D778_01251 [Xanthomarina gelatinilytica]